MIKTGSGMTFCFEQQGIVKSKYISDATLAYEFMRTECKKLTIFHGLLGKPLLHDILRRLRLYTHRPLYHRTQTSHPSLHRPHIHPQSPDPPPSAPPTAVAGPGPSGPFASPRTSCASGHNPGASYRRNGPPGDGRCRGGSGRRRTRRTPAASGGRWGRTCRRASAGRARAPPWRPWRCAPYGTRWRRSRRSRSHRGC